MRRLAERREGARAQKIARTAIDGLRRTNRPEAGSSRGERVTCYRQQPRHEKQA